MLGEFDLLGLHCFFSMHSLIYQVENENPCQEGWNVSNNWGRSTVKFPAHMGILIEEESCALGQVVRRLTGQYLASQPCIRLVYSD
jgi:hypothetical protein